MSAVDVVLSYLAAFSDADPEAIAAHVSEDFWNEHVSTLGASSRSRAEYRRRLPDFLQDFEGLQYHVEDVVADGADVVVAYRLTARYDGVDVALRGVFRFEVRAGLIAHRVDYFDSKTFLDQIGADDTGVS
jgi:ketosteroid isomerase-like protein